MGPPVLILVLKRFRVVEGSGKRYKLTQLVDFPLLLDIDQATAQDGSSVVVPAAPDEPSGAARQAASCYELTAVINHHGSLRGGHYTCYAKSVDSDHWLCFNDASVSAMEASEVVTPAAYILLYSRCDATATQPPPVQCFTQ